MPRLDKNMVYWQTQGNGQPLPHQGAHDALALFLARFQDHGFSHVFLLASLDNGFTFRTVREPSSILELDI